MDKQNLDIRVAHMVILTKACKDYTYMIKDHLHREDKQMLNKLVAVLDRFAKHFMEEALKDQEVDDALEDSAEYYLEATELIMKALNQGKTPEVLDALKQICNHD